MSMTKVMTAPVVEAIEDHALWFGVVFLLLQLF